MTALTAVLLTPVGPAAIWWSPLDGLVCSSPLSSLDHWSTISLSSHNWLFSPPKSGDLEMEEPVKDLALKISFKDPEKYKYGKLLTAKKIFTNRLFGILLCVYLTSYIILTMWQRRPELLAIPMVHVYWRVACSRIIYQISVGKEGGLDWGLMSGGWKSCQSRAFTATLELWKLFFDKQNENKFLKVFWFQNNCKIVQLKKYCVMYWWLGSCQSKGVD